MPAINEIYGSRFKSQSGVTWSITVSDDYQTSYPSPATWDHEFTSEGDGFKLQYHGGKLDVFDCLKASSLEFTWFIKESTGNDLMAAIFETNFDVSWYVQAWKDGSLYWWGYMQENTNIKRNKYYTNVWTFEAQDIIGVHQNIKVWDHVEFVSGATFGFPNATFASSLYRFGEIPTIGPFSIYSKEFPTIIEAVWSLLFDVDDNAPGDILGYTFWRMIPTVFFDADDWLRYTFLPNWYQLYSDYPVPTPPWPYPVQYHTYITVGEILRDILNVFKLRLFQSGGKYVLFQAEIYQSGLTITPRSFIKNPNSTGANPVYDGQGTAIGPVDYLHTPTKFLNGDSGWEKLRGIHVTSIVGRGGYAITGTFDSRYTRTLTSETNALSAESKQEFSWNSLYPNLLIYGPYNNSRGRPIEQTFKTPDDTNFYDVYTRAVTEQSEYRNGSREVLTGTFKNVDYTFIQGVSYLSVNYAPHDLTFIANLERWTGKWIETRRNTANIGEVVVTATDSTGQFYSYVSWMIISTGYITNNI